MDEHIDLIERLVVALIQATREVPGGCKSWDRLIDEAIEAIRLTPVAANVAATEYVFCECPSCHATGRLEWFLRRTAATSESEACPLCGKVPDVLATHHGFCPSSGTP